MQPIWKFRLASLVLVAIAGGVSLANLAAEVLRDGTLALPATPEQAATEEQFATARRVSRLAPFRSDLKSEYALARTGQAIKYDGQQQPSEVAKDTVKSALKIGPHDAKLWLVLALLQTRNNVRDPLVAESMKMSYLTGPGRAELIPPRLEIVTSSEALRDADLNELARSDVRAILTQLPDQRPVLVKDYARASDVGKTFLEQAARQIDPAAAEGLRSTK